MMLARLAVAAVLVLVASASGALADGRVALVIGNSTYAHAGRLPNAENDATDMAAALGRLGFEVTPVLDADFAELNGALRAFSRRSSGADVSLVFYAGHGMELDGVNYLVPVDARLERDTDVRYETATLDDVLAATTGATLQVVILDACRDNPLARSIERTGAATDHRAWEFRGVERGPAEEPDAGGVCGKGGDDGRGRAGSEQPVHVGVAGAPGATAGDRDVVPAGEHECSGGDRWSAGAAQLSLAAGC